MINYYIDENNALKVFDNSTLIGEVQQCQEMTNEEITCLASEIYRDSLED